MNWKKALIFISYLIISSSQAISNYNFSNLSYQNYRYSQMIDCTLSESDLKNNLDLVRMTKTDSLIILIMAPFAILSVLFVIITSFYYSKLLENPGDIILALAINELIKIVNYVINAIYYFSFENGPFNNSSFCQFSGSVLVVSHYVEDYYNIIFCLFILLRIRYLLKEVRIPPLFYHIFLVLVIILIVFLLKYDGRIGKNYTGVCGLKACINAWSFTVNGIQVLNIILVTITLRYFIKKLPSTANIRKIKAEIINYLGIYLIGQTFCRIFYEIFLFLLQINSYEWKSTNFRNYQFLLHLKMLFTPLLLLIMRYNHLFMADIVSKIFFCKNFYQNFLSNQGESPTKSNIQEPNAHDLFKNLNPSMSISMNYSEDQLNPRSNKCSAPNHNTNSKSNSSKKSKMSLEVDGSLVKKHANTAEKKKNSEKNEVGFFTINIISYNMKVMLTRSILTGVWISHKNIPKEEEKNEERFSQFPSKRKTSIFLETKRIPIHNNNENNNGKSIFELTMIVYAPKMFKKLLEFDKDMINFDVSLDLLKNDDNIKKANKVGDGGKSGQFFFCTHDNKLIIKTLSSEELQIFLRKFEDYYNYLTTHKDSLITKIYGVYTFFRKDIDISNHVIIMRNVVNTSKKNIVVAYDLKGSTFDREVLKDLKTYDDRFEAYKKRTTLKDSDFLKFERKIYIPSIFKDSLLKNFEEDTQFFRKMGFMDYSLFLVKVQKNKGAGLLADLNESPSNPLYSIESLNEPGIYYNIGIIDYFQKYTTKKMLEKYLKKIVHADADLDTSSQNPKDYANRFMVFMEQIIS